MLLYIAFLFAHLTVEDPLDEDVYMAPPFDWRFVEPVDMMEIGKVSLHALLLSC